MISARWRAAMAAALLVPVVAACSSDDGDKDAKTDDSAGLLTKSDLPFDATSDDALDRPHVMTQIVSSCIGTEQGVLYNDKWTVKAHEFYDNAEWTVISAVFTPPSKSDNGLAQVQAKGESCLKQETSASVLPLDVGHGAWAYEVQTTAGDFDSARAYVPQANGKLAQVSIYKMPSGEDAKSVLSDLVDKVG